MFSCVRSDDREGRLEDRPKRFNPRSCVRSDISEFTLGGSGIEFQSTLLREERRRFGCKRYGGRKVSIHAPA
jgi:hypothetical protein